MSIALSRHIGKKSVTFDLRLTVNYYAYRVLSSLLKHLTRVNDYLKRRLSGKLDELTDIMKDVYAVTKEIDPDAAQGIYTEIVRIRKMLCRQERRFTKVDYYEDVRRQLRNLIRITNRAEARVHSAIHVHSSPVPTPDAVKRGLLSQNNLTISNALREKADH
ncbi:MAG: hypothetical protein WED82_03200 [Balneolales bacterium]